MKANFILQKINGEICYDFVLTMVNAINYLNWEGCEATYEFIEIEDIDKIAKNSKTISLYRESIPVGSVEFVEKYIGYIVFGKESIEKIKPLNVPKELLEFGTCKRKNISLPDENLKLDARELFFIKSNDEIKYENNGFIIGKDVYNLPAGNWQISKIINDIESEYRCFIYKDNLLDIRRYLGNFKSLPDFKIIEKILSLYKWDNGNGNAPIAYTLDIANVIREGKQETEIIECHDFFSCGLYGFNDLEHYPYMITRAYNNIIKNIK